MKTKYTHPSFPHHTIVMWHWKCSLDLVTGIFLRRFAGEFISQYTRLWFTRKFVSTTQHHLDSPVSVRGEFFAQFPNALFDHSVLIHRRSFWLWNRRLHIGCNSPSDSAFVLLALNGAGSPSLAIWHTKERLFTCSPIRFFRNTSTSIVSSPIVARASCNSISPVPAPS